MPTDRLAEGRVVREHIIEPMLDLLDAFVAEAHRKDPHPHGHHNHHLCIQVTEWHRATSQGATNEQTTSGATAVPPSAWDFERSDGDPD